MFSLFETNLKKKNEKSNLFFKYILLTIKIIFDLRIRNIIKSKKKIFVFLCVCVFSPYSFILYYSKNKKENRNKSQLIPKENRKNKCRYTRRNSKLISNTICINKGKTNTIEFTQQLHRQAFCLDDILSA